MLEKVPRADAPERPAVDGGRKDDVAALRGKVDLRVVLVLQAPVKHALLQRDVGVGVVVPRALLAVGSIGAVGEVAREERAHDRVDLLDNVLQVQVGLLGGLAQLNNEPIDLVEDEAWLDVLHPGLAQHRHGLGTGPRTKGL